ncbi:flavin reductase family protein [Streptomyces sp. NPDC052023]|uniref:flavin reductase family protein n=1 Tax=Streptomyces sp. NPDC052023 TaxID=3365681 RepID=UPI0037D1CCFB
MESTAVAPGLMRYAMGHFATGVTVITTLGPAGEPAGCTVSAFCSLSLDPPLVLVCVGTGRPVQRALERAPGFTVNVLAAHQRDVAAVFARPGADRFAGLPTSPGRHGIPRITGALARIECDLDVTHAGGDHSIVVGRVRDLATGDGEPLLYARGAFAALARDEAPPGTADLPYDWLLSARW